MLNLECDHDMDDCKCCEIVSCTKCHRTDNEIILLDVRALKAADYIGPMVPWEVTEDGRIVRAS